VPGASLSETFHVRGQRRTRNPPVVYYCSWPGV